MNPYHKLLELSESETAPDHYQLLGLPQFAEDRHQIHAAAVARSTQLRSWDNSNFYREADALLDEVIEAAAVLEDPIRKSLYDRQLRQRLGLANPHRSRSADQEDQPAAVRVIESTPVFREVLPRDAILEQEPEPEPEPEADLSERNYDKQFLLISGGVIAIGLLIVALIAFPSNPQSIVVQPEAELIEPDDAMDSAMAQDSTNEAEEMGDLASMEPSVESPTIPEVESPPTNPTEPAVVKPAVVEAAAAPAIVRVSRPPDEWGVGGIRQFAAHSDRSVAGANWVAFSPDGKSLASADRNGSITVWNAETNRTIWSTRGHSETRSVAFSPDGVYLLSAGDERVRLWDAKTGRLALDLDSYNQLAAGVAFCPLGKRFAWSSVGGAYLCGVSGMEEFIASAGTGAVWGLAFSPDGMRLATSSTDKVIRIWDATSGAAQLGMPEATGLAYFVAYSPDGKQLVSAGHDRSVIIWNLADGTLLHRLKGHTGEVMTASFSATGRWVASASYDQTVRIWDSTTGKEVHCLLGHRAALRSVAFSPANDRLASAGDEATIIIWEPDPNAPATDTRKNGTRKSTTKNLKP